MTTKGLYCGADVRLTTLANGAATIADAHQKPATTTYVPETVDRVAPCVTVFGGDGHALATSTPGTHAEAGRGEHVIDKRDRSRDTFST